MSNMLREPKQEPKAIVEVYEDGGASRNNGEQLTPAAKNPWYVLATVAGEQQGAVPGSIDVDLHTENRRFWNGWMCRGLSQRERGTVSETLGLTERELDPLSDIEQEKVNLRFEIAFPGMPPEESIPKSSIAIDMSKVYFPNTVSFEKFIFCQPLHFHSANFNGAAIFRNAIFQKRVNFNNVYFTEFANFISDASFSSTFFKSMSLFHAVNFIELATFDEAIFSWDCFFTATQFGANSTFIFSEFKGQVDFSNAIFNRRAIFYSTFKKSVPEFHQSQMHQGSVFVEKIEFWPEATKAGYSDKAKKSYMKLRHFAAMNQDQDLEHFFLRQEMRCKEVTANRFDKLFFAGYRIVSDNGISMARPMIGLSVVILAGWHLIGWHLKENFGSLHPGLEGIAISIGNTFPFLGLTARFQPDLYNEAPLWLSWLSSIQTIAGIIFLFFLGLGLRNRFRLK